MKYRHIYAALIARAQARVLNDCYTENHHILPTSMGGSEDVDNLVKLTAKEHFVAHHLLWKIHRNREMTKAFMLMCSVRRNGIKYRVYAKDYQLLKEDARKVQSEFMIGRQGNNLGKTLPQEWRDNISKGQKGHHRGKGKSSSFKGKNHSDEAKKLISEKQKGNKNHLGIPHSEETKKQMSIDRLGKKKIPWTEERKAARSLMMQELHQKRRQEKSPD
jgi:hypothetical protein